MKHTKFNEGWKFWEDKDSFALVWNVPENAREVTLPHDAMLENKAHAECSNGTNSGYRDGGIYTYVKNFVPSEADRNRSFVLRFEGVYSNASVFLNGQLVGRNLFGYSTFDAKLSDYLKFGTDNEIRVQVRNCVLNSRWYSGSGIYRDVYLLEAGHTFISPDGLKVKTETAEETGAVLLTDILVENHQAAPGQFTLCTSVYDSENNMVTQESTSVFVRADSTRHANQRIFVASPKLWSEEEPNLYKIKTVLFDEEGNEVDSECIETFGIRTLALDAKRGFRVNGKEVKLRGACIHHDSGILGAATFEDAELRRVSILKKAGFNAIRCAHNPAAPALLRACDRLGMYVMEEYADMWSRSKSDLDYALVADKCWQEDLKSMVDKDFNHPSVVMYSVGNEIPEIGTDFGSNLCQDYCDFIKELDNTRFTTAGINGVFAAGDCMGEIMADLSEQMREAGEIEGNVNDFMTVMDTHMDDIVVHRAISKRLEKACAPLDIAGYNYMTARYEKDAVDYPNRVIVGSETYPPEIARNWGIIKKVHHVIGDFTWTGWDYIGEAGVGIPAYNWGDGGFGAHFPCQLAFSGDIDITGFRRPASYFREAVFGLENKPFICVQQPEHYGKNLIKTPWVISDTIESWTFSGFEGKPVIVEVYAGGDEVELLINKKSAGRKPSGEAAGYRVLFETTYEPGEIQAVVYEKGQEVSRNSLETADKSKTCIKVVAEETGAELTYVNITLEDEKGNVITDADEKIRIKVEGAQLLGFGSGNPKPDFNYIDEEVTTFRGRALAVLRGVDENTSIEVISHSGNKGKFPADHH